MDPSYGARYAESEHEEEENDAAICEGNAIGTASTVKDRAEEEWNMYVRNLCEGLQQKIRDRSLENLTSSQHKIGIQILKGNDVIIESWSETEINTVISILTLQTVDSALLNDDPELQQCQVLIMTPTEEMAEKVKYAVIHLETDTEVLCHAYHTRRKLKEDKERAKEVVHVIVGTPGRLYQMIIKNLFRVSEVRLFVIQMAEEILTGNSEGVVYSIFEELSQNSRVLLWSRTLEEPILYKCKRLVRDAHIVIKKKHNIHHLYLPVTFNMQKIKFLGNLRNKFKLTNAIVFCKSEEFVKNLKYEMTKRCFGVSIIDSKVTKRRYRQAGKFYLASDSAPITTNLVKKIFKDNFPVVINYDSTTKRNYFDRISRINSAKGAIVISFISLKKKERIEKSYIPNITLILPVYGNLPLCNQPNYEREANVEKSCDALLCQSQEARAENIRHIFIPHVKGPQKFTVLNNLYDRLGIKRAVIFCNLTRAVNSLVRTMEESFSVLGLGRPTSIEHTNTILEEFNSVGDKTLITSDVLDDCNVTNVSVVIFYDFSKEKRKRFLGICRGYSTIITFYTEDETKPEFVNAAGNLVRTEMQELLIFDEDKVRCCLPGNKLFDETFH